MGGTGNPAYPGGSFNPDGYGQRHGRDEGEGDQKRQIGDDGVFGILVQAVITGEGPVKNLTDHVTDPFAHNLLTNFANVVAYVRSNLRRTLIVIRKKRKKRREKRIL